MKRVIWIMMETASGWWRLSRPAHTNLLSQLRNKSWRSWLSTSSSDITNSAPSGCVARMMSLAWLRPIACTHWMPARSHRWKHRKHEHQRVMSYRVVSSWRNATKTWCRAGIPMKIFCTEGQLALHISTWVIVWAYEWIPLKWRPKKSQVVCS